MRLVGRATSVVLDLCLLVITVRVMHEQVHQRAGQQDQVRKPTEQMRPVFSDQIDGCYRREQTKDDRGVAIATLYVHLHEQRVPHTGVELLSIRATV